MHMSSHTASLGVKIVNGLVAYCKSFLFSKVRAMLPDFPASPYSDLSPLQIGKPPRAIRLRYPLEKDDGKGGGISVPSGSDGGGGNALNDREGTGRRLRELGEVTRFVAGAGAALDGAEGVELVMVMGARGLEAVRPWPPEDVRVWPLEDVRA